MAVVKANYVKRGEGEKGRAKATIHYIADRPGKDKEKTTRELFGHDGRLTKEQARRMIDEAEKGTLFYRLVISPDPKTEDSLIRAHHPNYCGTGKSPQNHHPVRSCRP